MIVSACLSAVFPNTNIRCEKHPERSMDVCLQCIRVSVLYGSVDLRLNTAYGFQ